MYIYIYPICSIHPVQANFECKFNDLKNTHKLLDFGFLETQDNPIDCHVPYIWLYSFQNLFVLLNMNFAMQFRRMGLAASFTRNQMLISVCETQKHIPNTYICLEAIQSYLFVSSCMLLNVRLVVCAHRWLENGIYIRYHSYLYEYKFVCIYIYVSVFAFAVGALLVSEHLLWTQFVF